MDTRLFPALGREIPVIGTGTWQLGIDLSEVDPSRAFSNLDAACASGVTFIDTADAYDNGASERFLGEFLSARPRTGLTVATKMGRSSGEKTYPTDAFSRDRVLHWNDRSRKNLGTETIDIVHLHAPPIELLQRRHLWELLDELVETERIRCYGVSVLTCAEALEAIQHPGCASVEIIVNVFRHKPLEGVLPAARKSGTAVIARVPLPDGLLSHNRRRSSTPAPPGSVAALDAGWI
jgi:oxidoreductase